MGVVTEMELKDTIEARGMARPASTPWPYRIKHRTACLSNNFVQQRFHHPVISMHPEGQRRALNQSKKLGWLT
jgi:hypothetical protein